MAAGGHDVPVTRVAPEERPAVLHSEEPPATPHPISISMLPSLAAPAPAPPPAATPIPSSTSGPSPTLAPARAAGSLADEVALLGEAKRALEAGRTTAALAAITTHERRFPRGVLAQEAAALRIEATARSGDVERAVSLSRVFEAHYPESPLRETVRSAAGTSGR